MLTFGFATANDALSWTAAGALGLKIGATLVLLAAGRDRRDRAGWGAVLWWTTKLAPAIAIPALAGLAWLGRDAGLAWICASMGVFASVAVPLKVRRRRNRIDRNRPVLRLPA